MGDQVFRLHGPTSFCGEVLSRVGLDVLVFDGERFYADNLSLERLPDIKSEVIFLWTDVTGLKSSEVEQKLSEIEDNPLWRKLPAVRAGRAFRVGEHWYGGDLEAYSLILDDVERYLT
ncbi:ABC transporter substrate-binding protein [Rubrobacter xylanophilus]|uniref:ABC transporter substrate-binding protein n=1 Tax=Rubrobacter xylanophilus TaxID=49319 RepID=UPI0000550D31|nr:ABC transporter substrate-binding protein [Rubrobacter xylanophilus]